MAMKLLMLVIFFAIMVSVGIYARKHATSVDGYVLGGRSVGPCLQHLRMVRHTFQRLYL